MHPEREKLLWDHHTLVANPHFVHHTGGGIYSVAALDFIHRELTLSSNFELVSLGFSTAPQELDKTFPASHDDFPPFLSEK